MFKVYLTAEDANNYLSMVQSISKIKKIKEDDIVYRINKRSEKMETFLKNTSYVNVITYFIKELSEFVDFQYLKENDIVSVMINRNSPIKVGDKRIIKDEEYTLEKIELGNNFGLELIFKSKKKTFQWEAFD